MYQLLYSYTADTFVNEYNDSLYSWEQLLDELSWHGWQHPLYLTNWELWVKKVD